MATPTELAWAVDCLRGAAAVQSQASLATQARECAVVVEALGYYDLADYLRTIQPYELRSDPAT